MRQSNISGALPFPKLMFVGNKKKPLGKSCKEAFDAVYLFGVGINGP